MHHLNHLGNILVRLLDLFSQDGSDGPSDIDAFIFELAIDGYSFARLFAAFLFNSRPVPCQVDPNVTSKPAGWPMHNLRHRA